LRRVAVESLNVTSGEGRGTSIVVDGEVVLGRSTACCEALRGDTEISRVHARVWRDGSGELMVEDLGSRNGTFLNGTRIQGARVLRPGDWLRAGHTTLELSGGGDPAETAPSYDALVEHEEPATVTAPAPAAAPAEPPEAARGTAGHVRPWPLAAVIAALLAGGGIGVAVAASQRSTAKTTRTLVITRQVERKAPPPRLSSPTHAAQMPPPLVPAAAESRTNPQITYPAAARDAFVHAFCGGGATAPQGVCGCTYAELAQREPYSLLIAQVARSRGGRVAPAVARAARSCGAGA
jgi:hypothetical protein